MKFNHFVIISKNYKEVKQLILVSDYDKKGRQYNIYLEAFPFKIYDIDIQIILDTAYDKMILWCESIKCVSPTHPFEAIAANRSIWIVDINGQEHELNRDKIVKGIGKALKVHKEKMLNYKGGLDTPSYSSDLCNEIIQFALFGKIRF